jgi:hypothetical protein
MGLLYQHRLETLETSEKISDYVSHRPFPGPQAISDKEHSYVTLKSRHLRPQLSCLFWRFLTLPA